MKPYDRFLMCVATAALTAFAVSLIVRAYHNGPEIVVYLDKDAKLPATLPLPKTIVVTGERAAFWWAVFNKASESKHTNFSDARYIANNALENVYGPVKK